MKNLLPFYFRGDIMQNENTIKKIIDIDNKAKDNLKDVIEKKRNFEKYAKQEICIKEGALFAKYKDTLEKDEREYTIKLQEEKSIIEENTSKLIDDMKINFNQTKDEQVNMLFESILKRVTGI